MLRRVHEILALLLAGISPPAGAQTFNIRNDPFGLGHAETAFSVEVMDDGNYLVTGGAGFDDGQLFYSSVVTSVVVDLNGQVINVDHFWYPPHATYAGWSNSMHKRADGGFVIGGSTFRTDSLDNWIQRPALYMLDDDGSVEQLVELGPEEQSWIGRQAKQTPDGGYVICGETSSVGNAGQAFVIKTDAAGSQEWLQTYGGQWNDFAMAIDRHHGTNYFMGGQKFIGSNKQLWVQCLDDTGGVAWSKVWGSAFGEPNAHLTLAADGNPLIASAWGYASNDQGRKYLAKLDSADGSVMWEKQYGASCACPLFAVKEVNPGGDLIAASQNVIANKFYGTLLRTTSTGDSLWMRNYQYQADTATGVQGNFYDVVPTPDEGFVAVGMAYPGGGYSQDVWVVKTDSMGCLEPGCHLVTGMETQITNLREALTVAPNPVAAGSNVQVSIALPENFTLQGALRLTVTDAAGRMVHEQYVSPGISTLNLPINLQPSSGLYHLHLSDATRWISGAKLIVE